MRFLLTLVALTVSAVGGGLGYPEWRANYEASLKAPDGWLSVAGLVWLNEGANEVKSQVLTVHGGKVTYQGRQLQTDASEHPDVVKIGNVSLTIIERGGKL